MDKKQNLYSNILSAIAFLAALVYGFVKIGAGDMKIVLIWWFVLLVFGLLFQPIGIIFFKRFKDNGWNFVKVIGLALSSWLVWYIASFKVIKFNVLLCFAGILLAVCVSFLISALIISKNKDAYNLRKIYSPVKISHMLKAEAIFFVVFVLWCYLKGFNAAAYSTEKFMDYGFLTAILKSDYMPPKDMWLSGNSINYYYVGQYICAFLIRVTGVSVGYGYNLSLMTLATFGFVLPFSIVYNLIRLFMAESELKDKEKYNKRFLPAIGATISGLSVSIAGNMHYPIYKWIIPYIKKSKGEEAASYWFANATRYIGYNPDVDDKTIHEFPSYSFVLGDLHAHVINIFFVLTVLALLLAWTMEQAPKLRAKEKCELTVKEFIKGGSWLKETFSPWLVACMMFIGLFHTTNFWDFPIYFVVSGAIILFVNLIKYRYKLCALILTAFQGLAFIVVGMLVALPFTLSFDSISTGINFCTKHTPFYQLMVLWGLPIVIVVTYVAATIVAYNLSEKNLKKKREKAFFKSIANYLDNLKASELYVLLLGLCAIGLILLPEVIYVVDIYGGAYQRSNTMFKLVYQAYIMFGLVTSFILVKLISFKKGYLRSFAVLLCGLLFCTYMYFFQAKNDWFKGEHKSLDASAFLADESEDDLAAIKYINENVDKDAIILEMCGLSYSYFNRISVFTGNPTVLGWQTHEWLWRSAGEDKSYPKEVANRHTDIVTLYTTTQPSVAMDIIKLYNIDYIYVGEAEHFDGYSTTGKTANFHGGQYTKLKTNNDLLKALGEVIMINANSKTGHEVYLVKVDKNKVFEGDYIANSEVTDVKYNYSKPVRIDNKDSQGNLLGYDLFTYDSLGNMTKEENYDANGQLVKYSEYGYTSDCIYSGVDYDSAGNRTGFWNYIDFDDANNCTMGHYFNNDDSWNFTQHTTYFKNGAPCVETKDFSDGSKQEVIYTLNEESKIEEKRYLEGDTSVVILYYYENGQVSKTTKLIDKNVVEISEYSY